MSKSQKPIVVKGKLKFKNSGGNARKSGGVVRSAPAVVTLGHGADDVGKTDAIEVTESLTESQKKHLKRKEELEKVNMKKTIDMGYRERVEAFNAKLSTLTEHNDIPRVSAAGNG